MSRQPQFAPTSSARVFVWVVLGLLPQCHPAAADATAAPAPEVETVSPATCPFALSVDGAARGEALALGTRARLSELVSVDPSRWAVIHVQASDGRSFAIDGRLLKERAELELVASGDGLSVTYRRQLDGAWSADLRAAARRPIAALDHVSSIAVTTRAGMAQAAPDPVEIAVELGGARTTLSGAALHQLESVSVRHGQEQGRSLVALVRSQISLDEVEAVEVEGAHERARLTAQDLVDADQIALLKINKTGRVRFRHYTHTDRTAGRAQKPEQTGGVRDVRVIRILLR